MTLCAVGNSLVTLMCHLFNVYDLIQHFQLDMVKLHRFLGKFCGSVSNNSRTDMYQSYTDFLWLQFINGSLCPSVVTTYKVFATFYLGTESLTSAGSLQISRH